MSTETYAELERRLSQAASREEAVRLIHAALPRASDKRRFAKHLDLPIPSVGGSGMATVLDVLVEGTVGYKLRSAAIRGGKKGDVTSIAPLLILTSRSA